MRLTNQNYKTSLPTLDTLEVFSDGSYRSNLRVGGWGVVLIVEGERFDTDFGACTATSSLEMELLAAVKALELALNQVKNNQNIILRTDSKVLIEGLEGKIVRYKQQKWHHLSGRPVKFRTLWEQFSLLAQGLNITVQWVKGHSGNVGNQLADQLARQAIDRYLQQRR